MLDEDTNVIDVAIARVDAPCCPNLETGFSAVLGTQSGTSAYTYSCGQELSLEGAIIHYNP
jgi:hypothetical protein